MAAPLPPRRRHRLRFGVRGLMILVLGAGLLAGGLDRVRRAAREQRAAVEAIRAGGGMVQFDWQRPVGGPRPKEPPAPRWLRHWLGDEPFQVVRAAYYRRPPDPGALEALARVSSLEDVGLYGPVQFSTGLRHLRGLPRLHTLKLGGCGDDAALADVATLARLRELDVDRSLATDAGFARLAALPDLARLVLYGNRSLTGPGLARLLTGMPHLRDLEVSKEIYEPMTEPIGPAVAALARHHPGLERLALRGFVVEDDDLRRIGQLAGLHELDLDHTSIVGVGLRHLRPLAGLTRLVLNEQWAAAADADIAPLADLTALEDLDLGSSYITDAGLVPLTRLTRLRRLRLSGSYVTDAGLVAFGRLPRLERLELADDPGITDIGLRVLARLPSLRSLDVGRTGVTAAGVARFHQVALRPIAVANDAVGDVPAGRPHLPISSRR